MISFTEAAQETKRLVVYLQNMALSANDTDVWEALTRLVNYAQIYSDMFCKSVEHFECETPPRARPILLLNQAILSSLSQLSRISKCLDRQMKGGLICSPDATSLITQTAQLYTGILEEMMSKVMQYLRTTSNNTEDEGLLSSAEESALMFIQLASSTSNLLKQPSQINKAAYQEALDDYTKQLDNLKTITKELKASRSTETEIAFVLIDHYIAGMAYKVRLSASDIYEDCGLNFHTMIEVYFRKDEILRTAVKKVNYKIYGSINEVVKPKITEFVRADTQLFKETSSHLTTDDFTGGLLADIHILTNHSIKYFLQVPELYSGESKTDLFMRSVELAKQTNEYALRVLRLLKVDGAEEVRRASGIKYLSKVFINNTADNVQTLEAISLAMDAMIAAVNIPQKNQKCTTINNREDFRSLMRAMTAVPHKLARVYIVAIKPFREAIYQLNRWFVAVANNSWDVLFRKALQTKVGHTKFIFRYCIQLFQNLGELCGRQINPLDWNVGKIMEVTKKLLMAEMEFINVLAANLQPLGSRDIMAIDEIQQAFFMMLYNPRIFGADATNTFESMLDGIAEPSSDFHAALSSLLKRFIETANAVKDSRPHFV